MERKIEPPTLKQVKQVLRHENPIYLNLLFHDNDSDIVCEETYFIKSFVTHWWTLYVVVVVVVDDDDNDIVG